MLKASGDGELREMTCSTSVLFQRTDGCRNSIPCLRFNTFLEGIKPVLFRERQNGTGEHSLNHEKGMRGCSTDSVPLSRAQKLVYLVDVRTFKKCEQYI